MNADRFFAEARQLLREAPTAVRPLRELVDQLREGAELYREMHDGVAGPKGRMRVRYTEVADPSAGIIDLGPLVAVVYATQKGEREVRSRRFTDYVHDFDTPRPILAFAADGSGLVIARGNSRYSVRPEGIVG